jgi:hypothetical protein
MMRSPVNVDITAGGAAVELFDFRSVPAPPWAVGGASAGVVASSPPPPSWRQEPAMTTTKTVASLSRRSGRRRGEDGKLQPSRLGHATAEGPPACHGGTWWATAAGLLVFGVEMDFGVENYWGSWAGAVSNPVTLLHLLSRWSLHLMYESRAGAQQVRR